MAEETRWIRHFSPIETSELETAARAALARGKALDALRREDFDLPTLSVTCREWLKELDRGRGFVLLRGLPVERWGFELSQVAYLGLGLQMGSLGSQNAAGDLLGHVRDTGEDPDDPSVRLYKTRRAQGFHTDGADVIGLLCLQGARRGGESRIVSSISVFNAILESRPDLAPLMFQPFHFDRNEEQAEGEDPSFAIPLAYYDGENLRMFYIGWYIRDAQRHPSVPRLTAEQSELLDLIDATADKVASQHHCGAQRRDRRLLGQVHETPRIPRRRRHLQRTQSVSNGRPHGTGCEGTPAAQQPRQPKHSGWRYL